MLGLFEIGAKLIDKLIPDPKAKQEAQLKLFELQQAGELKELEAETKLAEGQLRINEVEAASDNWFVSGWRPFCGWICGTGLGYSVIGQPILTWIASLFGKPAAPVVDTGVLVTLLLGLLGLGTNRMIEKIRGVARS